MKALWLVACLLLGACSGGAGEVAPAPESKNAPAVEPNAPAAPQFKPYPDPHQLAARVQLPSLAAYWESGRHVPSTLAKEPVLSVCLDKDGKLESRAQGEEWRAHNSDASLLDLLRRFGEESFDPDNMVSYCQVVVGADKRARFIDLLAIQEILVQARITGLFLMTLDAGNEPLLLNVSLPTQREPRTAKLVLVFEAQEMAAAYAFEQTRETARGPQWAADLRKIAARQGKSPETLLVSGGELPLSTVAEALNALAALGFKHVRFVP